MHLAGKAQGKEHVKVGGSHAMAFRRRPSIASEGRGQD